MACDFTIPSLQASLDRLRDSQTLTLASRQIERLFGLEDDAAMDRLERFAEGHRCIVSYSDHCIVFRKRPPGEAPAPGPRAAPVRLAK